MVSVFLYDTCPLASLRATDLLVEVGAPTLVSSWDTHGWNEDYAIFIDAMVRLGILDIDINGYDSSAIPSTLVIAKTSISSPSSSTDIASYVTSFSGMIEYDVFYMSKWLDRCDQYEYISSLSPGLRLVRTYNPHGFHALAFNPGGIEKILDRYHPASNPVCKIPFGQILNDMISNVHCDFDPLVAVTTTPTMITFDIIECRQNDSDGMRMSECRDIPSPAQPGTSRLSTNLVFFWFLIIAVIVFVTAWVLVKMGMRFTPYKDMSVLYS